MKVSVVASCFTFRTSINSFTYNLFSVSNLRKAHNDQVFLSIHPIIYRFYAPDIKTKRCMRYHFNSWTFDDTVIAICYEMPLKDKSHTGSDVS